MLGESTRDPVIATDPSDSKLVSLRPGDKAVARRPRNECVALKSRAHRPVRGKRPSIIGWSLAIALICSGRAFSQDRAEGPPPPIVPSRSHSVTVPAKPPPVAPLPRPPTATMQPRAQPNANFQVPLQTDQDHDNIQLSVRNGLVSLVVRKASLREVLATLAETEGLNIVCAENVDANLSVTLHNVPLTDMLDSIVSISGCTWAERENIIHVSNVSSDTQLAPELQGVRVKVFQLDFVASEDLLAPIKSMLSSVGNAYSTTTAPDDARKANESIVVQDLPRYLSRIEQYIRQADQPPRQVMIQVHVLQVALEDGCRHGVNFTHVMNIAGHTFDLKMAGFAAAKAPQAFFAELSANNLTGLIEALKTTVDAKTLASPKVMALNGQLAHIQIGEKLGYRVLKNTQTSTLEDVQFLDVGVVLEVTPTISRDGRVLMKINPKVSTGQVDSETGLPQEATTEVQTNVLLSDGQGVVIGGLIQEVDTDEQSKVMFLGDLYLVGSLFQRRKVTKSRKEIIFFLVPKVVPCGTCADPDAMIDAERSQTPLFHGPLHENPRPWEPKLPSCYEKHQKTSGFRLLPRTNRHGRYENRGFHLTDETQTQRQVRTMESERLPPIVDVPRPEDVLQDDRP